ncbi:MAG: thymidylate synthase [Polyangiaceae bacterium]
MYLKAASLDDILRGAYGRLIKAGVDVHPSQGACLEDFGSLIGLTNPRARLSWAGVKERTLFSSVGEFLWYAAGSDNIEFVQYYVPEYPVDGARSAYGPRVLLAEGTNQWDQVAQVLKQREDSRRAVIQLFRAEDSSVTLSSAPCTCTVQFVARGKRLHMMTFMRSNDAYIGLPHDVFAFTMYQELMARQLGLELGVYWHSVGSLHLYKKHVSAARRYRREGWQSTKAMHPMPVGNQCRHLRRVVALEEKVRRGERLSERWMHGLPSYWKDICRLLEFYRRYRARDIEAMRRAAQTVESDVYSQFLEKKIDDARSGFEQR